MARIWYVKIGFAGYGPDLDCEDVGDDTFAGMLETVRWELDSIADCEHDAAEGYADSGDFETAWKTHKLIETFDALRQNLDRETRRRAPLYVDNLAGLDESLATIVAHTFPLEIEIVGSRQLYVWEVNTDQI